MSNLCGEPVKKGRVAFLRRTQAKIHVNMYVPVESLYLKRTSMMSSAGSV